MMQQRRRNDTTAAEVEVEVEVDSAIDTARRLSLVIAIAPSPHADLIRCFDRTSLTISMARSFVSIGAQLLFNTTLSDVEVRVPTSSSSSTAAAAAACVIAIPAHSLILSARSSVLHQLIVHARRPPQTNSPSPCGGMGEADAVTVLELEPMHERTARALFRWLYTDALPEPSSFAIESDWST